MLRRLLPALLLVACVLCASPAVAQTPSQSVFRRLLLNDRDTSPAIRNLLRHDGGFVNPAVTFADLTGDRRSDAVVMVTTGGAAGNVALYVFSADGPKNTSGQLRAVFRVQSLYRASARISGAAVLYRTPQYESGDTLSSPSKTVERTLRWNKGTGTMRITASRQV